MNFVRGLEKLFSGFAVDADTRTLKGLLDENEKSVFIIKKSKYYITLMSFSSIFVIVLISCVNVGLFFLTDILPQRFQGVLGILLTINILRWFATIVLYLRIYDKNYGVFRIMSAAEWVPVMQKGDKLFRRFFNHTVFLILIYIFIIMFFIWGSFILLEKIDTKIGFIIGINLLLFIRQFHQIIFLLRRFVNLEMDFVIVTKYQIKHYNQQKFGIKTKTLDTSKIKTIKSHKLGKLRSILNYGEVHIFTDGDVASNADLALKYIIKPEMVEKLLYEIKNKNENQ